MCCPGQKHQSCPKELLLLIPNLRMSVMLRWTPYSTRTRRGWRDAPSTLRSSLVMNVQNWSYKVGLSRSYIFRVGSVALTRITSTLTFIPLKDKYSFKWQYAASRRMFNLAGVSYRQHVPAQAVLVIDFNSIEGRSTTEQQPTSDDTLPAGSNSASSREYEDMTLLQIEEEIAKLQALKKSKEKGSGGSSQWKPSSFIYSSKSILSRPQHPRQQQKFAFLDQKKNKKKAKATSWWTSQTPFVTLCGSGGKRAGWKCIKKKFWSQASAEEKRHRLIWQRRCQLYDNTVINLSFFLPHFHHSAQGGSKTATVLDTTSAGLHRHSRTLFIKSRNERQRKRWNRSRNDYLPEAVLCQNRWT